MCLLTFLFLLRVLGQMLVAFLGVTWLPPMNEWYSGLMPYPWLLPTQILILMAMVKINTDVLAGREALFKRSARVNQGLLLFSVLYAAGMLVRYVISGTMRPERRWWPPGVIPIVFHWVLAAYVFLLARRPPAIAVADQGGTSS